MGWGGREWMGGERPERGPRAPRPRFRRPISVPSPIHRDSAWLVVWCGVCVCVREGERGGGGGGGREGGRERERGREGESRRGAPLPPSLGRRHIRLAARPLPSPPRRPHHLPAPARPPHACWRQGTAHARPRAHTGTRPSLARARASLPAQTHALLARRACLCHAPHWHAHAHKHARTHARAHTSAHARTHTHQFFSPVPPWEPPPTRLGLIPKGKKAVILRRGELGNHPHAQHALERWQPSADVRGEVVARGGGPALRKRGVSVLSEGTVAPA